MGPLRARQDAHVPLVAPQTLCVICPPPILELRELRLTLNKHVQELELKPLALISSTLLLLLEIK